MALLKQLSTDRVYWLTSDFSIGRESPCSLTIDNRLVSSSHASLRWNGTSWVLRDLGSVNGTFLHGEPIAIGKPVELGQGARLAFGDKSEIFELIDATPPQARARADSGEEYLGEDGLLILPHPEQPEITIFATEAGSWLAEKSDGTCLPVFQGSKLEAGGKTWHLDIPKACEPTLRADDARFNVHKLSLRFHVSRDQETVSIELTHRGQTRVLPDRAHMYLMLILARARLEDQSNRDLPESEHGWRYIPDLLDDLDLIENHFNVAIYRARQQFARAGIPGATMLFERRQGTREIRIGIGDLEIVQ